MHRNASVRLATMAHRMASFWIFADAHPNLKMVYPGVNEEIEKYMSIYRANAQTSASLESVINIINAGYTAKQHIWSALSLPDNGRLWIKCDDPASLRASSAFSDVKGLMQALGEQSDTQTILDILRTNTVKSGQKFTRFLIEACNTKPEAVEYLTGLGYVDTPVYKKDPNNRSKNLLDDNGNPIPTGQIRRAPEVFANAVGDSIDKTKKPVMISANPLDILLASNESKYTSCHAIQGIGNGSTNYYGGTVSYAMSKNTLIMASVQDVKQGYPYYKTGRQWVYFGDDLNAMVFGKTYGFVPTPITDQIGQELGAKISAYKGEPNTWNDGVPDSYPREKANAPNNVYFDGHSITKVVWNASTGITDVKDALPTLNFVRASNCVSCGQATTAAQKGLCSTCASKGKRNRHHADSVTVEHEHAKECSSCSDDLSKYDESKIVEGEAYCDDCFDERYEYCQGCDEYFHGADLTSVEIHRDYRNYCPSCLDENTRQCMGCQEYMSPDYAYSAEDEWWCEDCYSDRFSYCEHCNEDFRTENGYSVEDEYICDDCTRTETFECPNCDDRFFNSNATENLHDENCDESEEKYCNDCTRECVACEGEHVIDHMNKAKAEGKIIKVCDHCVQTLFVTCPSCRESVPKTELGYAATPFSPPQPGQIPLYERVCQECSAHHTASSKYSPSSGQK
jgi:hypothetical protein